MLQLDIRLWHPNQLTKSMINLLSWSWYSWSIHVFILILTLFFCTMNKHEIKMKLCSTVWVTTDQLVQTNNTVMQEFWKMDPKGERKIKRIIWMQNMQINKSLSGQVQCFSMQVVMNKCFLLNLKKKNWQRSVLSFSRKTHALNPKNDVTETKARLL